MDQLETLGLTKEQFQNFATLKKFPVKTTLLYEGEIAAKVFFVKKGALRLWNNNDGNDVTVQFFFEDHFVASFESFQTQTPSKFSLECSEDCELFVLERPTLTAIFSKDTFLKEQMLTLITQRFTDYIDYFLSRLKNTPEKRYQELKTKRPDILARVPNYYIASYLGITPVSLSRIQKRVGD